jgi:hypothetical protein
VKEPSFLEGVDADRLAGLVMELASQLHIERQRRMALEHVLAEKGVIDRAALEALADDPKFLAAARAELDRSLRQMLRIVTEAGDKRAPLRAEAPR